MARQRSAVLPSCARGVLAMPTDESAVMNAAQELLMKAAAARPLMDARSRQMRAMLDDLAIYGTYVAIGHEVCARRARKLKRRGDNVRFCGRTKTGKSRYRWMKRIEPWALYREAKP